MGSKQIYAKQSSQVSCHWPEFMSSLRRGLSSFSLEMAPEKLDGFSPPFPTLLPAPLPPGSQGAWRSLEPTRKHLFLMRVSRSQAALPPQGTGLSQPE